MVIIGVIVWYVRKKKHSNETKGQYIHLNLGIPVVVSSISLFQVVHVRVLEFINNLVNVDVVFNISLV